MQSAESIPLATESVGEKIIIDGIEEPVIWRYFETLNAEEFGATAGLFACEGVMYPPFEEAVVGGDAIATYLEAEAKGMKLYPKEGISQMLENGQRQVQIAGQVQTPWFGINVSWLFLLNQSREIVAVTIKLLASPQELLSLRR